MAADRRTSPWDAGLTADSLRDCLAGLPPVDLKGMALLRECRPAGQFFPPVSAVPRATIVEAVTELVAYTERCRRALEQLMTLTPIPLTAFSIVEYGL